MQVNDNLSQSQLAALQSTLTFVESITALDCIPRPTAALDVELTKGVQLFAELVRSKLLAEFPSLAHWRATGNGE